MQNVYTDMIVILAGVLGVFLTVGQFVVQITPQNQGEVSNVMTPHYGRRTPAGIDQSVTKKYSESPTGRQ